jgi:hypothetical protein
MFSGLLASFRNLGNGTKRTAARRLRCGDGSKSADGADNTYGDAGEDGTGIGGLEGLGGLGLRGKDDRPAEIWNGRARKQDRRMGCLVFTKGTMNRMS